MLYLQNEQKNIHTCILLLLALSEMKIIVNILQNKYHYIVVWKHYALKILTINFGKQHGKYFFFYVILRFLLQMRIILNRGTGIAIRILSFQS